ncbi:hypothetical protein D3C72_2464320 [compost metagenome]
MMRLMPMAKAPSANGMRSRGASIENAPKNEPTAAEWPEGKLWNTQSWPEKNEML